LAANIWEAKELFTGNVGPIGAGEGKVYWVDLQKKGLYQLSIRDGVTEGEKRKNTPERLFAADEMLRNIFCDVKFGGMEDALELDWTRINTQNQVILARYRYDLARRTLTYEKDLPQAPLQEALDQEIFLYDEWQDSQTSTVYGLGRLGTAVLPARRLPNGQIEIADIPDMKIRWL
jgi:hypothetical protein